MMEKEAQSFQEKKIRKITQLYYSRPDIQKIIFDFSKNREISPRYFEGFGKRPDSFQFKGDILGLAKKGATSFNCSEELWEDSLKIFTGMSKEEGDKLRIGWDLLVDIDCEHGIKYSILAARSVVKSFEHHGIKNVGIKFSGSKGFHILLPWKAFPKILNGIETKNLFPDLPRKLIAYLRNYSMGVMRSMLPEEFEKEMKDKLKTGSICKNCGEFVDELLKVEFSCKNCGIVEEKNFKDGKGQIPKCYKCKEKMEYKPIKKFLVCQRCEMNSNSNPKNFGKEEKDLYSLMGVDLALISPRHLFRMPYSLHEKTSLSSVVIDYEELENFKFKDADPLRIKIKNFMPNSKENEASEFVMQALDWTKTSGLDKEMDKGSSGKYQNFKSIKLQNLKDSQFPPCIKGILKGIQDGKKRALFVLINFFRSIGLEKEDLEKRIFEWNKKNEPPLKKGYINSQLSWTYKRKPLMPPNFSADYYSAFGLKATPEELKLKNPVNYVVRKNFLENRKK